MKKFKVHNSVDLEVRKLEQKETKKVLYVHFIYKYDRVQALSGSMREVMYPFSDQSSLKFFTEYTEPTSRVSRVSRVENRSRK